MKNILVLIAVLGFVACSSKEKKENNEMAAQQTEATESQANDEAKKAYDEAQKEAEAAAQKAAQEASDSDDEAGSAANGDFGPYEGTEKSKFTCTSGDDVRTVAVLDGTDGGCGVVYNKMGSDRTIAVAQYDMEFCPEVQNKVKGNLEAAGFTCE